MKNIAFSIVRASRCKSYDRRAGLQGRIILGWSIYVKLFGRSLLNPVEPEFIHGRTGEWRAEYRGLVLTVQHTPLIDDARDTYGGTKTVYYFVLRLWDEKGKVTATYKLKDDGGGYRKYCRALGIMAMNYTAKYLREKDLREGVWPVKKVDNYLGFI